MTFTISAWGPDGRTVVKREGPIAKTALYNGGFVSTPRELERRKLCNRSSTCLPVETAGRANNTLGDILYAYLCADPSEARW